MTAFSSLGLSEPLLRAVQQQGYETPSPIQAQAIPVVLEGRDLLAAAQTGTGKTAGFTLPMLQRLSEHRPPEGHLLRALVLTPTRELAAQVGESVSTYGQHLPLRSAVVFGGVSINPQKDLLRKGVDILVATPGRLLDLHGQGAIDLSHIQMLVLDEADRMLDMGFIHDIRRVLKLLPAKRQNLLFSATFSPEIKRLTQDILHNPTSVEVARNATAHRIEQAFYETEKGDKMPVLAQLILSGDWSQVLVFTRTKHGANRLSQQLEKNGISAAAIHGNKSQNARTRALANFKSGETRVLVATDIAARGLDIDQLPHVVNYELPNVPADYVHRIGRTGRAGASGEAISLVSRDESKEFRAIEKLLRRKFEVLPAPVVDLELLRRSAESYVPPAAAEPQPKKPAGGDGQRRRRGGNSGGAGKGGNSGKRAGNARNERQASGNRAPGRSDEGAAAKPRRRRRPRRSPAPSAH
ncbi:ATP-dependent RNA helicase RhlE [Marinobacterium nitratireducens]|uniref:DEAD-box ATP-dependent RNA helicase RhpA n=1 Tax=Marinobacterium nitratireducens TaxID=518897 RepID=A0A917Z810_9GAMM|nr:DEAD/DEAH box helicase [Marinobacterium nitratireducens]GGO75675.1 ATP-dependent RNA helicase RhlE [Marinobacterium nitratireducens]